MDVVLRELFTTRIGLLSLFTIGFMLVMAVYIYRFAIRNMKEDERKAKEAAKPSPSTAAK